MDLILKRRPFRRMTEPRARKRNFYANGIFAQPEHPREFYPRFRRGRLLEPIGRQWSYFQADMSDSSEPINEYGELSKFISLVNSAYLMPQFIDMLECPMVIHYGFVDLEWKAKIGREFWAENWAKRSGREENVATNTNQLSLISTIFHNLNLK